LLEEPDEERKAAARRLVSWYAHTSFASERAIASQRTTELVVEPDLDGVRPSVSPAVMMPERGTTRSRSRLAAPVDTFPTTTAPRGRQAHRHRAGR
jgi:hypothetical protein